MSISWMRSGPYCASSSRLFRPSLRISFLLGRWTDEEESWLYLDLSVLKAHTYPVALYQHTAFPTCFLSIYLVYLRCTRVGPQARGTTSSLSSHTRQQVWTAVGSGYGTPRRRRKGGYRSRDPTNVPLRGASGPPFKSGSVRGRRSRSAAKGREVRGDPKSEPRHVVSLVRGEQLLRPRQ